MRSFRIVEGEICTQSLGGLRHAFVVLQIHFLILDASPESLHEDVIPASPSSIPTDADVFLFESVGEIFTGELRALIAVEDVGLGAPECSLQGCDAEEAVQGVGEFPGEHVAAEPVHYGHQIDKAVLQPDVGDVGTPHLVGALYDHVFEQIGISFGRLSRPTQPGLGIDRLQSHYAHQTRHTLSIDAISLVLKPDRHTTRAIERRPGVLLVDETHQGQVERRRDDRLVVEAGTGESQQLTLTIHRDRSMPWGYEAPLFLNRPGYTFFLPSPVLPSIGLFGDTTQIQALLVPFRSSPVSC